MAEQQVTSPDQHKPGFAKPARIGALLTAGALLLMLIGNHEGRVEDIWLAGIAGIIILVLLADWALRKNGIKR